MSSPVENGNHPGHFEGSSSRFARGKHQSSPRGIAWRLALGLGAVFLMIGLFFIDKLIVWIYYQM